MNNVNDPMMSVEAQLGLRDVIECGFRLSQPIGTRHAYMSTTLRPVTPNLPGYLSCRAVDELKDLGFLDKNGTTVEGLEYYRTH